MRLDPITKGFHLLLNTIVREKKGLAKKITRQTKEVEKTQAIADKTIANFRSSYANYQK